MQKIASIDSVHLPLILISFTLVYNFLREAAATCHHDSTEWDGGFGVPWMHKGRRSGEGVNNWIVDLGLVLKSLIEVNRGLRFEAKS